ncbi:hypothetical protein J7399_04455 [Shimia sp. R9_1]|uniref:hypothetical protein n=1 Tax=Shimia sp. R9_1 TaxID=2821111 RepID=UPI001AD95BA8|nr:hypothetical protein [Shimia sp. R9_1]MBO9406675.1 hypothetical protein [Shimia sp. R9_1]
MSQVDDGFADAIRLFAQDRDGYYGTWHAFESTQDLLAAIVAEIGETVLARRIAVFGKEQNVRVLLTVSNRHLVDLEGVGPQLEDANGAAVIELLSKAFAGCATLKFEIVERSPELPETDRSWSHASLLKVLHEEIAPVGQRQVLETLRDKLKAMALSWRDVAPISGQPIEGGNPEDLGLIDQCLTRASENTIQQKLWKPANATLNMLSIADDRVLVLLETPEGNLGVVCRASHRAAIFELWRAFVAATS